jgi:hypothetical protein
MENDGTLESKPWWRFGHVWLVIAGPAIVVVAGFITLYLAIMSPNEIVSDQDMEARSAQGAKTMSAGKAPAMQARNHAQTGVVPLPEKAAEKP